MIPFFKIFWICFTIEWLACSTALGVAHDLQSSLIARPMTGSWTTSGACSDKLVTSPKVAMRGMTNRRDT
jgi:hypothetical protein